MHGKTIKKRFRAHLIVFIVYISVFFLILGLVLLIRSVYMSNYCYPEFGVSHTYNKESWSFNVSVHLRFQYECYFLSTCSFIKVSFENKYNHSYNLEFLEHIAKKHSSNYLKRVLITKFDS
jgi:hypothetical protein